MRMIFRFTGLSSTIRIASPATDVLLEQWAVCAAGSTQYSVLSTQSLFHKAAAGRTGVSGLRMVWWAGHSCPALRNRLSVPSTQYSVPRTRYSVLGTQSLFHKAAA